jgi:trehalose 6-phosphate synthase/phosphatase
MEYTICQEENKNPLILSEFTGVTGSMKSAVKVNPWDLGVSFSAYSPWSFGFAAY